MRKAGDIITDLFKNQFGKDFVETARSSAELFNSWEKIVCEVWPRRADQEGDIPAAAVHSGIRELERGVLLVEADHPGWIQILQTKQAELLKAVQRRFSELDIRGLAFTLSRGPLSPPAGQAVESLIIESSGEKSSELLVNESSPEALQDKIQDKDFYTALKRLEKSAKKRNVL